MINFRLLSSVAALATSAAVAGQITPSASPPPFGAATGDADRLAADMRLLASDPRDVSALADAGERSLRLGDVSGAASLFARADKVDPSNGRVKAGMAGVLLRNERPGEALVYFGQAEGYGVPVASFAADRGLAYDLVGQQGRAQRDYRLALAAHADDEVVRRYALSLAISGQKEAALLQLDPLVRRGDRGAWRARAFVIAMGGDAASATDIARRMMAPGQAEGLAPFFQRLPTLSAVDRAFAVQFGEVRPTAQRIADARMAPALPPMAPELVALPVARAGPVPAAVVASSTSKRRGGRGVQLASAVPAAVPVAAVSPPALPAPPAYSAPVQLAYAGPVPTTRSTAPYRLARPGTGTDPVSAANASMLAAARGAMPQTARAAAVPGPALASTAPSALRLPALQSTASPAASVAPAPLPSAAAVPPIALAATAKPPIVAHREIAPAGAQVSVFSNQFHAARVRDAAAASANRSALAASPATLAPAQQLATALPAATAPSAIYPSAPARAVSPAAQAEAAPVTPVGTPVESTAAATASAPVTSPATGESDAVLSRLLARITLPGEELARAARLAAAPVEQTAAAGTAIPASVPSQIRSQEAPAPAVAPPFAPPSPADGSSATSTSVPPNAKSGAPAVVREATPLVKPATHASRSAPAQAELTIPSRGSSSGRESARAGAPAGTEPSDQSPATHGRRGRIEIADAATKPRSRRGEEPDRAGSEEISAERPSRGEGDRLAASGGKSGRHGKQPVDGQDPPLTSAQKRAADRKLAADAKVAEAKKLADEQRAADAKEAAEAKKAARAEPQRFWVQVSGGANEADLPKAWAKAQGQASALKGRNGYTTPLRATNRVLAGPFKTNAEAKAFMDKVRAQGIPAWQFTSEPGQKVSKLP